MGSNNGKIDIRELARRGMRDGKAYHPSISLPACRLDTNESPWNLPENVRGKLIHWLQNEENLNRYPDSGNTIVRESAARLWGVLPGNVTCGLGSDQIIDIICRVFLEPGDCIVTQSPTFGMYAVSASLAHGRAVAIPAESEGGAEDIVRAALRESAKIVFVCSPNNPTGHSMPEHGLRFILENARCVVAVDEAYGEFSGNSMVSTIDEYPNLIVLRTCSKAFGLAGARVGYAMAGVGMIELLDAVRPPYNIPTISQLVASWALDEASEFKRRAGELNGLRDELYAAVSQIRWLEASRSDANFIYVRSERDVAAMLEEGGVSVRRLPMEGSSYHARISVGTREENKKVGDILCAKPN